MATTNPAYKPSESKREEFRRYLEKTGVMDGLTKALVNLYEEAEKPADALQYIQDKLAIQMGNETLSALKAQIAELNEKIVQLEIEKAHLEGGAGNEDGEAHHGGEEAPPVGGEEGATGGDPPAE